MNLEIENNIQKDATKLMLRGINTLTLDYKGRFTLPKRYREQLVESCQGEFVCTVDCQFPTLLIYPLPEWIKIESKLAQLSSVEKSERRLQRILVSHAFEGQMDKQGRLLVASALRNYASLHSKIVLIGQLNKFELWDQEIWQKQIEQDLHHHHDPAQKLSERLSQLSL